MKLPQHSISLIISIIIAVVVFHNSYANQTFTLDEINPDKTRFSAFNSYKHGLLLVAITQKNQAPFDCQPNRYIFYDYANENYFELLAGNLLLNSDYSKIFMTKILTLGKLYEKNSVEWKKQVQQVMATLNVSSQTMEKGKTKSGDGISFCWQQPEVLDMKTREVKTFSFLAANPCKFAWCSDFYWVNETNVQLWVQINPNEFHRIRLDVSNGTNEFIDKTKQFFKKTNAQDNAPRANLVTKKNLTNGSFTISSQKGKGIRLVWSKQKNNKISINLIREGKKPKASLKINNQIDKQIKQKKYAEALQTIKFGFWLDPENKRLKVTRLKTYASLFLIESFFKYLSEDFTDSERFDVCQELHIDKSLKNLWKQKHFAQTFKEKCP